MLHPNVIVLMLQQAFCIGAVSGKAKKDAAMFISPVQAKLLNVWNIGRQMGN